MFDPTVELAKQTCSTSETQIFLMACIFVDSFGDTERLHMPLDQNTWFLNSSFPWSDSEVSPQSEVVFTMKNEFLL